MKRQRINSEQEVPTTSSMDHSSKKESHVAATATAGVGFMGETEGNTELNAGFQRHYEEINTLHSRKIKVYDYNYILTNEISNNPATIQEEDTAGLYPVPYMSEESAYADSTLPNLRAPFNINNPTNNFYPPLSLNDLTVTNPLNLYLRDFLDGKLYDFNATTAHGLMTQYTKFKLSSINIELEFKTYNTGLSDFTTILNNILGTGTYKIVQTDYKNWTNPVSVVNQDYCDTPTDYYVLRDVYNDYGSSDKGNEFEIPLIPGAAYVNARRIRDIRNLDSYLTVVKAGEKFNFTRNIAPRGSYYLTLSDLYTLRDTTLNQFVSLLEGLNEDPALMPKNLFEGFNILFSPVINPIVRTGCLLAPVEQPTPSNKKFELLLPMYKTSVWVKYTAKWEAFDFNYIDGEVDPDRNFLSYSKLFWDNKKEKMSEFMRLVRPSKKINRDMIGYDMGD